MRAPLLVCVGLCLACTRARAGVADEPRARDAEAVSSAVASDARALSNGVLRTRFGSELPLPSEASSRRRCPEETLAQAGPALPLRLRDVRSDKRQLLPLRLTTTLTSTSARRVGDYLRAGEGEGETTPPSSLAELRYLAEFAIEAYTAPRLFRRKDAPRSEWSSALLAGRLIVYDVIEGRPLCDSRIDARISGEGRPIRRALRDATRERMTSELERSARAELERALATMSSAFRLEPWPDAAGSLALADLSR